MIGILVAVIVVVIALVAYSLSRSDSTSADEQIIPLAPSGQTTTEKAPARVPNTTGITGVLAWNTAGYPGPGKSTDGTLTHDHVTGPVKYAVLPPVGGPHNPTWMNAGVYTKPIPAERAVHNMEHGAVWITYQPDLPADQVTALQDFVGKQSLIDESAGSGIPNQKSRYIDMSPWSSGDLPAPIVISAWGYQLRVQNASDPRLQQFVDTFRHNQKYTPEFGAAVDGIPIQTGGRAAMYGATEPNPDGLAAG